MKQLLIKFGTEDSWIFEKLCDECYRKKFNRSAIVRALIEKWVNGEIKI